MSHQSKLEQNQLQDTAFGGDQNDRLPAADEAGHRALQRKRGFLALCMADESLFLA